MQYIGNRVVPRHDGAWNAQKGYEPLIIVYDEESGNSFISRKNVPPGTPLSQEDYWALFANSSEQLELLKQELEEKVDEMEDTVSKVGIKDTEVSYQAGESGTIPPSGNWEADIPAYVPEGWFLWVRVIIRYRNETDTTFYIPTKQGTSGSFSASYDADTKTLFMG